MLQYNAQGGANIKAVYIDVLFLINLMINYLLLIATARMTGAVIHRKRMLTAASAGAVYAVVMFFPRLRFLYTMIFKLLFAIPITMIAFGTKDIKKLLRLSLVFFMVSFAFAGCVMAIYYISDGVNLQVNNGVLYMNVPFWMLVLAVMTAYILIGAVLRKSADGMVSERHLADVCLNAFSNEVKFTALHDSGNELTDPMTNKKVIVVEYESIKNIFPTGARSVLDFCDLTDGASVVAATAGICRLRVIPYRTVGNRDALMAVFTPDLVTIDGKARNDILVGLSAGKVGEEYSAVVNL